MIKAIIIEDEEDGIKILKSLIEKFCPEVSIAGTAKNVEKGIALINEVNPELVFLDIQLPGGTGFDILQHFPDPSFEIIFTTANDQYAIQAIRFSAIDYLLKPIQALELQEAVGRISKKNKTPDGRLNNLVNNLKQADKGGKKLGLPLSDGLIFVTLQEIIHCESSSNYTWFYLTDNRKVLVSKSLKEYEELLTGYDFMRVHQSHMINVEHIAQYSRVDGGMLVMSNKTQIPISRRNKDILLQKLNII